MKKILIIISVLVLLLGVGAGVYLVQQGKISFLSRAGPTVIPQEVKITNISDNSFTVSWITPDKEIAGFIAYGDSAQLGQTAADDRDQIGSLNSYFTHHVSLKNLSPQTKYFFKIGSGSKTYDQAGQPYEITTAPTTDSPPPLADPSFGTVVDQSGKNAAGALVYLTVANSTPLSSYTREDGNWLITLNNARSKDLSGYVTYKEKGDKEEIMVQAGSAGTAFGTADTSNDSPVPTITLGKSFVSRSAGFSLQQISTPSAAVLSPPVITNPSPQENLPDAWPIFRGTGVPGQTLTITIRSNPMTATVAVGADGQWSYTPTTPLPPGKHTITVSIATSSGQPQSATQKFTVLAQAETPAATPGTLPQAGNITQTFALLILAFLFLLSGAALMKRFPTSDVGR